MALSTSTAQQYGCTVEKELLSKARPTKIRTFRNKKREDPFLNKSKALQNKAKYFRSAPAISRKSRDPEEIENAVSRHAVLTTPALNASC